MSDKVSSIAEAAIRSGMQQPVPNAADAVFRAMHGFYGQLWLSKFATRQTGPDGADAGVMGAKAIWAHGLKDFNAETVRAALRQCMERHPEFPPSLPQFLSMCRANAPREVFKPAITMSGSLIAEYNKAHREKLRELRERIKTERGMAAKTGLPALFAAIADAVACAGGDEVAKLRQLERMLS